MSLTRVQHIRLNQHWSAWATQIVCTTLDDENRPFPYLTSVNIPAPISLLLAVKLVTEWSRWKQKGRLRVSVCVRDPFIYPNFCTVGLFLLSEPTKGFVQKAPVFPSEQRALKIVRQRWCLEKYAKLEKIASLCWLLIACQIRMDLCKKLCIDCGLNCWTVPVCFRTKCVRVGRLGGIELHYKLSCHGTFDACIELLIWGPWAPKRKTMICICVLNRAT